MEKEKKIHQTDALIIEHDKVNLPSLNQRMETGNGIESESNTSDKVVNMMQSDHTCMWNSNFPVNNGAATNPLHMTDKR